MRYIIIGLIAGVVVLLLSRWASSRPAARDTDGWSRVTPGATLHGTVALSAIVTCFCLYILMFVGSARSDAAEQMVYLRLLIFAFAAITLFTAWMSYATRIRWRDGRIVAERLFRATIDQRFSDVRQVAINDVMGTVTIGFSDNSALKVSTWMTGVSDLIAALSEPQPDAPRRPDLG